MITCFCLSSTVALFYDETIPNYYCYYFNCHITPSLPLLSLSTHHPSQCLQKATAPASTGGTCRPTCRSPRVPIEPLPPPHPLVGSGRGLDPAHPHRIPPHRRPRPPHHRHPRYCCNNNHLHPHHLSTLLSNITPSYSSNPLRCFYHYHLITLITTSFITPITTTLSWRRAAGHSPHRRPMKLLLLSKASSRGGRPQSAAFRRISTLPPPPL